MKRLQTRLKAPDAIRVLSLLGVFLYHLDERHFPYGYLGVIGFLCLAGFLCMRKEILEPRRESPLRAAGSQFLGRLKKLWPPFLLFLLVLTAVMVFVFPQFFDHYVAQLRSAVLGANNIWQIWSGDSYFQGAAYVKPLTHLWALSLELQFYLIFALTVTAFYREKQRPFWIIFFSALTLLSFVALYLFYLPGEDPTRVYYGPDTRFFSFSLGALAALLTIHPPQSRAAKEGGMLQSALAFPLFCLAGAAFAAPLPPEWMIRWGLLLYSLLISALLALTAHGELILDALGGSFLFRHFSQRGYAIYLWHYPFFRISERLLAFQDLPVWYLLLFQVSGAIFAAELTSLFFDFLKYRRERRPLAPSLQGWTSFILSLVLILAPWHLLVEARGGEMKKIEESIREQEARLESERASRRASQSSGKPVSSKETTAVPSDGVSSPERSESESSGEASTGDVSARETSASATTAPTQKTALSEGSGAACTLRRETQGSQTDAEKKPQATDPIGKALRGEIRLPEAPELSNEEQLIYEAVCADIDAYNRYGGHYSVDLDDYARYRYLPLTMIGDSVSVIASYVIGPYLPALDLDAKSNRQMGELFTVYQEIKEKDGIGEILVVALGTNGDPDPVQLELVRKDLGDKPMLLLTIVLPYQSQEEYRNQIIRDYAASHRNVWLVEWNEGAKFTPDFFQEDAIHPSTSGCKAFSQLITAKLCEVLRAYENAALLKDQPSLLPENTDGE